MYLYANGCSMTYGMELVDDPQTNECLDHAYREAHSWPGRLGDFLGVDAVVNDAVISGSNQRILRTTLAWVTANLELVRGEPGLVVIGWSGAMRREFFVAGGYRQVIPYQEHEPRDLQRLVDVYREVAWHDEDDASRLLVDIVALQAVLTLYAVPYVFFDAVDESFDCFGRVGLERSSQAQQIDRRRYFGFEEPGSSMSRRLRATELPWAGRHPSVEGHEYWAGELAAFVMENDLFKPPRSAPSGSPGHAPPPGVAPRGAWAEPDTTFIYP